MENYENLTLNELKNRLKEELKQKVNNKIIEEENYKFLAKWIDKSEDRQEVFAVASMGTTYNKTGFTFNTVLEHPMGEDIYYFKKNTDLSFKNNDKKITHKLIIGDNYPALLNLMVEYKNKVDVIYIDPPYGKDSMGEFAKTNYENDISRDHLLSMLYPRLQLAKQLLSENGVIFCSIDDKNQAYVKGLFDEVFGEQNFISNLIWKCRNSLYYTEPTVSIQTEYILLYAKNKINFSLKSFDKDNINGDEGKKLEGFYFNRVKKKYDDEDYINPDNDPRGPYKTSGKVRDDGRPKYTVVSPTGISHTEAWVYSPDVFQRLIEDGQIYWGIDGSAQPRKKSYYKDFIGNVSSNLLMDEYVKIIKSDGKIKKDKNFEVGTTETGTNLLKDIMNKCDFPYPKPVQLIKYLVSLYPNKDINVLDFFAGSGTTGQAVMELNREDGGMRQFILCTSNEITDTTPNGVAYDVTTKRLKRVMTGECYDGANDFEWIKKNKAYEDNLDVIEIDKVYNAELTEGNTPFDVIDETLYGEEKFKNIEEKIKWVCMNFEHTQRCEKEKNREEI